MSQNSIQGRNKFKVIILGESCVGKTSLAYRYVNNRFLQHVDTTVQFDLYTKKVVVEEGEAALQIWDTAGMEKYRAMTREFGRSAKAAIVCTDMTREESFKTLCYWIDQIPEDCKIYICVTKNDLLTNKNVENQRLTKSIASELNYPLFTTSSKTGEGIDEMFQRIASDLLISNAQKEKEWTDIVRLKKEDNTEEKKGGRCCSWNKFNWNWHFDLSIFR